MLAFADDTRFGRQTLQAEGLDKSALENAIKDMRGSNRVTDQVLLFSPFTSAEKIAPLQALSSIWL